CADDRAGSNSRAADVATRLTLEQLQGPPCFPTRSCRMAGIGREGPGDRIERTLPPPSSRPPGRPAAAWVPGRALDRAAGQCADVRGGDRGRRGGRLDVAARGLAGLLWRRG